MNNNELQHHGIKGMRWGVRRTKAQLARARGSTQPRKVTKEEYEAAKEKAINSGDVKTVRAWESKLTNNELRTALDRVDLTRRLSEAEQKNVKSGLDHVEDVMNNVGRVTNVVNTGLNAYGVVAKVNNTFNSKQLPTVDGKYYKDKQAEAKKKADNESAKEAREAAKETREAKRAADAQTIQKLIGEGKIQKVIDDYGTYDPNAVQDAMNALNKKKELEDLIKNKS